MFYIPSRFTVIAFLLTSTFATTAVFPQWYAAAGLDFWTIPTLQEKLTETEQMNEELDDESQWVSTRIQEKSQIIKLLIQDKISFEESLERFYKMNTDSPRLMSLVRFTYPSSDDREATALSILAHVDAQRFPSKQAKQTLREKLQREIDRLFPTITR